MTPGRRTRLLPATILALALLAATQALAQGQQAAIGGSCSTNGATTTANISGQTLICVSGVWTLPSIYVGADSGSCTATNNGEVRYTSGTSPPYNYCNGSAWVPFESAGFVPAYSIFTASSLSVGPYSVCALKNTGVLWCWGYGAFRQLGLGNTTADQAVPATAVTNFAGPWSSVTASYAQTCGIKSADSSLWCWGNNTTGQLGDGTITSTTTAPVQVTGTWSSVSAGGWPAQALINNPPTAYFSCGVKNDGSGWCWGGNGNGQIGDGTTTERHSPVQITGTWSVIRPAKFGWHTCGIKTDNSLWCWGYNAYGQIGNSSTTDSSSPVQIAGTWSSVSVGGIHTCGIKTDNSLWCWGNNTYGQLGDGTVTERHSPVQVGSSTWSSISVGGVNTVAHTCGIKTDNSLWCWGYNQFGQLNSGDMAEFKNAPSAVVSSTVTSGSRWTEVRASNTFTCGIRDDSTVYCWGLSDVGRNGDPNFNKYFTPVSGN